MRLDKYIASVSDFSRSGVKQAIKSREVLVNGVLAKDPAVKVSDDDEVCIFGNMLRQAGPRYIMLNKPDGYVCATKDSNHGTVIDLIFEDNPDKLHIAGRLDVDTTGLVLITDDGKWTHRVISPNSGCVKRYLVDTEQEITDSDITKMAKGMMLTGEHKRCKPALLTPVTSHQAWLEISEGKFHQVKRMFEQLNNRVTKLHRAAIGDIMLDQNLAPGEYRWLTPQEIESI